MPFENLPHHEFPEDITAGSAEIRQRTDPTSFLESSHLSLEPTDYLETHTWEQVAQQAEGAIVVDESEALHSTVVGLKKTGKSSLMYIAAGRLGSQYADAGMMFRASARKAIDYGYEAGQSMSPQLVDRLLADLQSAKIQFAQPTQGHDQSIIIGDSRYEYDRDLESVDPTIAGLISQNPAILRMAMDVFKDQIENAHQLMFVGGRSLNQEFKTALARFYIEREGASMPAAEKGDAWNPDSPKDNPRIIDLFNPEGRQELAAEVMALVVARRAEARVSDDQSYLLPAAKSLLISAEPAKAAEINYALANRENILRMPSNIDIPNSVLDELREALLAKANHARTKYADPLLTVESTTLFIPDLYKRGVPSEFVEWLSKKDMQRLVTLLEEQQTKAAAVTLMAQINEIGEMRLSQGVVSGTVFRQGQGEGGIGWDAHFMPDGLQTTYAEMGEVKSIASSRAIAARELLTVS